MGARPVYFLSDFGEADEFAGVCRLVIERYAPATRLIDLTHGIAAGDIRRGALALEAAVPYATAAAVSLAVVDPGVGTSRRALALRAGEGFLVGPDNGLLVPAAESLGGAAEVVDISATPVRLEPTSHTFHGRDIFSPVAAALARGGELEALGEPVDPASVTTLELPTPRISEGRVAAHALYADGFGNVILDATSADLAAAELANVSELAVRPPAADAASEPHGGSEATCSHRARRGRTFADGHGGLVLYDDSSGRLGLALAGSSAAAALAADRDHEIAIEAWA